jgi:hypothetical protein
VNQGHEKSKQCEIQTYPVPGPDIEKDIIENQEKQHPEKHPQQGEFPVYPGYESLHGIYG